MKNQQAKDTFDTHIIILALVVFCFVKRWKKKKAKATQYKDMLDKIERLEKENIELKSKIAETKCR